MLNLYVRLAVGETIAVAFLPLVVAGLYNLVTENFSKPYFLIIGLAGTCLSHLISTVFYWLPMLEQAAIQEYYF